MMDARRYARGRNRYLSGYTRAPSAWRRTWGGGGGTVTDDDDDDDEDDDEFASFIFLEDIDSTLSFNGRMWEE
jgi:hypothetical protein